MQAADIDRARVEQIIESARARGTHHPDRVRVEGGAGVLRHPDRNHEDRAQRRGSGEKRPRRWDFPIVLKLFSETITHKTDVGGVQLNLRDGAAVSKAYRLIETSVAEKVGKEHFLGVTVQPMVKLEGYEIILGSSIDPQFGPVLLFGLGGQLVEVFKDKALSLPPLNTTLARRMMEQTKILHGAEGRSRTQARRSRGARTDHGALQPVGGGTTLHQGDRHQSDARLPGADHRTRRARLFFLTRIRPRNSLPRLAIRPYPAKYISKWKMKDGEEVTIRPIRPEDEPAVAQFHEGLSDRTVYLRYLQLLKLSQRVSHERLTKICFIDYGPRNGAGSRAQQAANRRD